MESTGPRLRHAEGPRQSASFFLLIASFLLAAEREVRLGNILEVGLVSV